MRYKILGIGLLLTALAILLWGVAVLFGPKEAYIAAGVLTINVLIVVGLMLLTREK